MLVNHPGTHVCEKRCPRQGTLCSESQQSLTRILSVVTTKPGRAVSPGEGTQVDGNNTAGVGRAGHWLLPVAHSRQTDRRQIVSASQHGLGKLSLFTVLLSLPGNTTFLAFESVFSELLLLLPEPSVAIPPAQLVLSGELVSPLPAG